MYDPSRATWPSKELPPTGETNIDPAQQSMIVLSGLLQAGRKLHMHDDTESMLETILNHARLLTGAEAGSVFLLQEERLKFVTVQNDRIDTSNIAANLLGKDLAVSTESIAGFVAMTGRLINIPDTSRMPTETQYAINRDFDRSTGYRTQSLLALPLTCPDGKCVGVLQLINRIGPDARTDAFGDPNDSGVLLLASSAAIAVHNAILQKQLRQAHLATIYRLAVAAEYRDNDTGNHIKRVSRTSELIARAMGMDNAMVDQIKHASQMHDIGKVAVPDAILLKPGPLTPAQREIMKTHTTIAAEILADPEDEVMAMGRDIALNHHERWDGKGYPNGVSGREIPLSARIVAVADAFDAVVSPRCYKAARSLDAALDIITKDSGHHFDPEVTEALFAVVDDIVESSEIARTHSCPTKLNVA